MGDEFYTADEAEELEAVGEIDLPDVDQELKDAEVWAEIEAEYQAGLRGTHAEYHSHR